MQPAAQQVESILAAAVELESESQRQAFVEKACAGDAGLKRRVEELIENHFRAGSFLESPAAHRIDPAPPPVSERPGMVIGPYKLLEVIGEGGMGVVFLAEQQHPVRRQVALKVVKPGMDTWKVIARFEAERQALALMDHPHIARVFDAGATETGRPYFVMELVQGVPITAYCDAHRLTPLERLELFVPVCQAVQHAHTKGIIHRDLKPSNVLVTLYDGRPVAKVIDFGIAKATGPRLTERTLSTEVGQVVGTPEYMSPEQAELNPLDIDTRSDIYSLGVLLYELLTGTTPLQKKPLREAALLEVLRLIREEEPPRPSTRLSTTEQLPNIAANRGLVPADLSSLIRGELDWIVMKCLDKDRSRRYETANALAKDLQRYLDDEPVEACPPSASYRLRKFAHKNRKLLGTVAAFLAVVLLAGVVTAYQAVRLAQAERDRAERAAAQAEERALRNLEVHTALNRAQELRFQARSAAVAWGKWAEAMAWARRAEALLDDSAAETELARQVHDVLRELADEAADRRLVARLEEIRLLQAEVNVAENRFLLERALPEYRQAFRDYGWKAEALAPQAVAALLQCRPPAVRGTLVAALDHWLDLARQEDAPEVDWLERVLAGSDSDAWRQRLRLARGRRDRRTLEQLAREVDVTAQPPQALFLLDRSLHACGAKEGAVALLRRAQEAFPGDFWTNQNLGTALAEQQPPQLDDAIRFLTAAVALRPESPGTRLNLGLALERKCRYGEAITACRKATELKRDYAEAHHALGLCFWKAGRPDEAITALRQAIALKPLFAEAHAELGSVLAENGRPDEAMAVCRWAIELKPTLSQAHYGLGNALMARGRLDEAIAAYRQAIDRKPDFAEAHCNLGVALDRRGRSDEAIAAFRQAIALKPDLFMAHFNLGLALADKGRLDEAVAALRRAIEWKPDAAEPHYDLGNALRHQGRFVEAVAAYRRAIGLKPDYAEAHCNLGCALQQQGKLTLALAAFQRGHELGSRRKDWPYPSARWLADCQRLVELDARLHALKPEEVQPANVAERMDHARLCYARRRYAAAARFWADAFIEDPKLADDVKLGHRHEAACVAALAAVGQGGDAGTLGDEERARWRKQALEWLRAELTATGRLLQSGKPEDRRLAQSRLRHWQRDRDLASLREPAALARLSDEERAACRQLWAEVDRLLTTANVRE